jgi:hypothetical protein
MFGQLLRDETRSLYLPKYVVADKAPETLIEVIRTFKETNKLVVWSGASELTIWGTPQDNYLFRAWHDYCHILGHFSFDAKGESATCLMQQSQIESSFLQKALNIEINGQLEHMQATGNFPLNQIEFFKLKLKE